MQASTSLNLKRNKQEMLSLIQEQQTGDLPVKTFCELKGISEACYYYWRKKYINKSEPSNEPQAEKFRLLKLEEEDQNDTRLFAEYKGLKFYRDMSASYLKELMR
jgi:hypothetical protein